MQNPQMLLSTQPLQLLPAKAPLFQLFLKTGSHVAQTDSTYYVTLEFLIFPSPPPEC